MSEPIRILLATDGSPMSELATDLLVAWAPESANIRVLAVHPSSAVLVAGPWPTAITDTTAVDAAIERRAHEVAEGAAQRLAAGNRTTEAVAVPGRPANEIAAEAERWSADVVVAGARGHGTLERLLVGSVTSELLGMLRVPLLIARDPGLEKALVATDGSGPALDALEFAATSPLLARSHFRVVSIAATPFPWWAGASPMDVAAAPNVTEAIEASERRAREATEAGMRRLRNAGREADSEVGQGQAAAGIVEAANAWGASIIITGSHGHTALAGLLLGSVARAVSSSASCSVLVVPRRNEQTP